MKRFLIKQKERIAKRANSINSNYCYANNLFSELQDWNQQRSQLCPAVQCMVVVSVLTSDFHIWWDKCLELCRTLPNNMYIAFCTLHKVGTEFSTVTLNSIMPSIRHLLGIPTFPLPPLSHPFSSILARVLPLSSCLILTLMAGFLPPPAESCFLDYSLKEGLR